MSGRSAARCTGGKQRKGGGGESGTAAAPCRAVQEGSKGGKRRQEGRDAGGVGDQQLPAGGSGMPGLVPRRICSGRRGPHRWGTRGALDERGWAARRRSAQQQRSSSSPPQRLNLPPARAIAPLRAHLGAGGQGRGRSRGRAGVGRRPRLRLAPRACSGACMQGRRSAASRPLRLSQPSHPSHPSPADRGTLRLPVRRRRPGRPGWLARRGPAPPPTQTQGSCLQGKAGRARESGESSGQGARHHSRWAAALAAQLGNMRGWEEAGVICLHATSLSGQSRAPLWGCHGRAREGAPR